jgi:c-di-GMP-binding flagellar brake protein YcgR
MPGVGDSVELLLADDLSYQARAVGVEETTIVLVLAIEGRDPLELGEVPSMRIEFAAERGLVQLSGHGEIQARDVVRFIAEGEVEVQQRREFVRVRAVRPAAVAAVEEDGSVGEWIETLTVNLSGNGVLLAGPESLRLDAPVRFRLALVDGEPYVEGSGVIARVTGEGRRGIAIRQLDVDDHRRLVHFIFERERIARRLMRDGEL